MKKLVQEERHFCDVCGGPAATYSACHNCGKDFCYECAKTYAKEYNAGVYHSGSGDFTVCLPCDADLTAKRDPKMLAYHAIQALRHEAKGWGDSFEIRRKEAEDAVKQWGVR